MNLNIGDSNIQRTHDFLYLKNDKNQPPKECFVKIANLIQNHLNSKTNKDNKTIIADIGCAAGEFPGYLQKKFPNCQIEGYEYLKELLDLASINYPNVYFQQATIFDLDSIKNSSCDVITLCGVLSIFDDIEPIIKNLSFWIKPGGKIFLFGAFNTYEIDVFIKYRYSKDYEIDKFESGWNIISQKTLSNLLYSYEAKQIVFHDFNLSLDLKRRDDDPVRSWTEKLANGKKQIVNGLCIKQPTYIVEISF